MKQRRRSRLLLLMFAAFALILASCASSDDDGDAAETGGGDETAATCQGTPGEEDTAAQLGSAGDGEGEGVRVGMVFDVGGLGDQSFNDSAFAGLSAAEENLGVEIRELEPDAEGSNREALVRQLADDGYDLIIGVGFAFDDVLPGVASDYPDISFAGVDTSVEGDNLASLQFAEEQGSFLVGAAAAQASRTGTIGFIGGVDTGLIKKFEAGFVAGVEAVDPDATVEVKYLSTGTDFSGFNDPAKGETTAAGLYEAGADVVYHASGGSGSGVFNAAEAADRLAIGVDSNQYLQVEESQQPCILTSMLKRVDVSVYETITTFVNDEFEGGFSTFDLANEGVGYATQGGQVVDAAQLDDFKQQIIDGTVTVPTAP